MKKLLSLFLFAILLTGCSSKLSYSEESEEDVNNDISSFIDDTKDDNGVHLYFYNQNAMYVYLNGTNVKQGEKAVHFTNFDVERNGETLNILYSKAYTSDYLNESLNHELFYKVNLDKDYVRVKLLSNGEEASFGVISGKQ